MSLSIVASGMVTPVGFSALASCAAMRAQLDGFTKTRFSYDGDWLTGAAVLLPTKASGRLKDLQMASSATDECIDNLPPSRQPNVALALCVAERDRPGRVPWLDRAFFDELVQSLRSASRLNGLVYFGEEGPLGVVDALDWADRVLTSQRADYCVVVGLDSYLHLRTLDAYHARRALITAKNVDGFIPGEAATAVALARASRGPLQLYGVGRGVEPSVLDPDKPAIGEGLTAAYREALSLSGFGFDKLDYRLSDLSGAQGAFKEAAFALGRTMRVIKDDIPLWSPGECVGNVGAASIPLLLGVALHAWEKGYGPGPGALCHAGDDRGQRAAWVVRGKT